MREFIICFLTLTLYTTPGFSADPPKPKQNACNVLFQSIGKKIEDWKLGRSLSQQARMAQRRWMSLVAIRSIRQIDLSLDLGVVESCNTDLNVNRNHIQNQFGPEGIQKGLELLKFIREQPNYIEYLQESDKVLLSHMILRKVIQHQRAWYTHSLAESAIELNRNEWKFIRVRSQFVEAKLAWAKLKKNTALATELESIQGELEDLRLNLRHYTEHLAEDAKLAEKESKALLIELDSLEEIYPGAKHLTAYGMNTPIYDEQGNLKNLVDILHGQAKLVNDVRDRLRK